MLRRPAYRGHFRERLGTLPATFASLPPDSIWVHAVSVGEVVSVLPLLRELRQRAPQIPLYLSTSTVAGRRLAEQRAAPLTDGIFYAPIDFVFFVRRTLQRIRPGLVVVLETEVWPNLFFETRLAGAGLAVVNGRISDRTFPTYRRLRGFFLPVLHLPNLLLTQSRADTGRFLELGAPAEVVHAESNLKYDAMAEMDKPLSFPTFGADKIWIAASTVGPNERGSLRRHSTVEEAIVIEAFQQLASEFPRLLLILAPRQPDRFDEAADRLRSAGVRFVRRSQTTKQVTPRLELPGVLLLDTLGELASLYPFADAVFVGGSLAPRGGHNILEPALAAAPIVVGPHMHNFQSIFEDFRQADAIEVVASPDLLFEATRRLLVEPQRARALGLRGQTLSRERTGVSKRVAQKLLEVHAISQYRRPRALPIRICLEGLARVWEAGGRTKRRRAEAFAATRARLTPPVLSVGGLTIGGSGKTPFANYLLGRLRRRGFQPALLTRGYRRRSPAKHLIVAPGADLPTSFTGDEAQIFLRSAVAPVGIGADRYRTAQLLLAHYPETDVLVLDDGFQHARLPRDLDIVLIDGHDPFGGDSVVPAGRLREPLAAVRRAHVLVVTRPRSDLQFQAIRTRLFQLNPDAPVFAANLEILGWRDMHTGEPVEVAPGRKAVAFCALGNPRNFWSTLESMGLSLASRIAFEDHHAYKPAELRLLRHEAVARGADLLVTTEKDRFNLPALAQEALGDMQAAWLEISLCLPDEAKFFAAIDRTLRAGR